MALTFPLALGSFANLLPKTSVKFWLEYAQEASGIASGQVIVADLAPPFWSADMTLINLGNDDWRAIQALFYALDGGISDFYMYDPRCEYPASDPGGTIISGSTITNTDVATNGKVMSFTGFEEGFVLTPGDMFCFDYGPGNAYRALHMVVVGGTANGSGNIANVEFRPHLDDPTISTGKTMDFTRPSCRMKLIPGSFTSGEARQMMTTGLTFRARQIP